MKLIPAIILSILVVSILSAFVYWSINRKDMNKTQTQNLNDDNAGVVPSDDSYDYTEEQIAQKLKALDPSSYHVIAEGGTETPFNNEYWDNKAEGIYVDKVTGKPLFSSTHKYDSGTGWPSFYRTIDEEAITLEEDNTLGMTRTEVRSDSGHLGHVFEDGPQDKGGQRYCLNSASLQFVPREEMEEKGYGDYLYLFKS